jgi:parallel beta-helix repeat protein
LRNCGFSVSTFRGNELTNDLDTSNTVNGKPIYYWVNVKDQAVPSDVAYLALVKCANITVKNSSPQEICIVSTVDSIVSNINLGKVTMNQRGDGINLLDCSGISIISSVVHDKGTGIKIANSSKTIVSGNDISYQITKGIDLVNSVDTAILGNSFINNSYGIGCTPYSLSSGTNVRTMVASNNFTGNDYAVSVCGDMNVHNNVFESNDVGITFSGYSGNTIAENIFSNNKNALYFSDSSGNSIYLNNFLNNDHQVTDAGVSNTTQLAALAYYRSVLDLLWV